MIYFFSYGDDKYKNSKHRIRQEAINFGFDRVDVYGREDISPEFIEKTQPYINMPRGGGYWLWKPYFLKKTFEMMKEGDYCVYADAGCTVNPNGKIRFNDYLKMIDSKGILSFRLDGFLEEWFTTEEIFKNFNIEKSSTLRRSDHLMATIYILKKCDSSIEVVNDYFKLSITKPDLFSDIYNSSGNCESFRDNRHDQSVFSILRKLNKSIELSDETYSDSLKGWQILYYDKKIPFLSTRIRN